MMTSRSDQVARAKSMGMSQGFALGIIWTLVTILIIASLFF